MAVPWLACALASECSVGGLSAGDETTRSRSASSELREGSAADANLTGARSDQPMPASPSRPNSLMMKMIKWFHTLHDSYARQFRNARVPDTLLFLLRRRLCLLAPLHLTTEVVDAPCHDCVDAEHEHDTQPRPRTNSVHHTLRVTHAIRPHAARYFAAQGGPKLVPPLDRSAEDEDHSEAAVSLVVMEL